MYTIVFFCFFAIFLWLTFCRFVLFYLYPQNTLYFFICVCVCCKVRPGWPGDPPVPEEKKEDKEEKPKENENENEEEEQEEQGDKEENNDEEQEPPAEIPDPPKKNMKLIICADTLGTAYSFNKNKIQWTEQTLEIFEQNMNKIDIEEFLKHREFLKNLTNEMKIFNETQTQRDEAITGYYKYEMIVTKTIIKKLLL